VPEDGGNGVHPRAESAVPVWHGLGQVVLGESDRIHTPCRLSVRSAASSTGKAGSSAPVPPFARASTGPHRQ
jgi:hypothetical protein